jgi:hypothetical protein
VTDPLGATGAGSAAPPYPNQRTSPDPGVGGQAGQQPGGIVDQAKQAVSNAAGQAGEKISSGIESQKDRAAQGIGSLAGALRQAGQQLRDQDQQAVPQYIDTVAGQVERFSNYLQSSDVRDLLDEVETFARRQPALFLGGAFALGLLGARFLKSSSEQGTYAGEHTAARNQDYGRRPGYGRRYGSSARAGEIGRGSLTDTGTVGGGKGI